MTETVAVKVDEGRAMFEAWAAGNHGFHGIDFEWHQSRNCYANFGVHFAYKAWVASRAALVVELPDSHSPGDFCVDEPVIELKVTTDILRAAGITVKGDS